MFRAALISALVSAGLAGGVVVLAVLTGRWRTDGAYDATGPRFDILLQ